MSGGLTRVEGIVAVLAAAGASGDVVVNGGVWRTLSDDERVPFRLLCADIGIRLVESLPIVPSLAAGDRRLPCNPTALAGSAVWVTAAGTVDGCWLLGSVTA